MKHSSSYPPNAQDVFALLTKSGKPLSAYQILAELSGSTIRSPTQVYRALSVLLEGGDVHRVESLNAFVICSCAHQQSRPGFLICRQCGTVAEFDDQRISALEGSLQSSGFEVEAMALELSGLCLDCRCASLPA